MSGPCNCGDPLCGACGPRQGYGSDTWPDGGRPAATYYRDGRLRHRPANAVGFGREIRRLAAEGLTSRDIEVALGVDAGTVREALRGSEAA